MLQSQQKNSDYYTRLDLDRDPFSDEFHDESYLLTPELQHRLDLCNHLLEFSQQVIIVRGKANSGKTAFLKKLVAAADEDWLVCLVEGNESTDTKTLVNRMLTACPGISDTQSETIAAINSLLDYCVNAARLPVLIIDNAHLPATGVLRFVLQLVEIQRKGIGVKVMLAGDDELLDTFNSLAEEISVNNLVHSISIPALSREQTDAYIQHRLTKSGGRSDILSGKEVHRIYKVSAGLPGEINFLARQGLSDPAMLTGIRQPDVIPETVKGKAAQTTGLFLVAAVLTALAAYFLIMPANQEGNTGKQTVQVRLPPLQAGSRDRQAGEEENAAAVPVSPPLTTQDSIAPAGEPAATGADPAPLPLAADTEVTAEESTEDPGIEASAGNTAGSPELQLKSRDWLLAQSVDTYVLQLMGAKELGTITGFLGEAPLQQERLALYSVKQAGGDWHVLVYGLYPDLPGARAAIATLPERAKAQSPWPKAMRAIHEALEARD